MQQAKSNKMLFLLSCPLPDCEQTSELPNPKRLFLPDVRNLTITSVAGNSAAQANIRRLQVLIGKENAIPDVY